MNTNFLQSSAYELAEKLYLSFQDTYHEDAANMLRKQADRIAELEKESANLEHSLKNALIFINNTKQSEPVGKVIYSPLEGYKAWWFDAKPKEGELLYATPQTKPLHDFNTLTLDTGEKRNLKRLSDEEIIRIWNTCETDDDFEQLVMKDFILFARAIEAKVRGQ